jgi:hypothetical protein
MAAKTVKDSGSVGPQDLDAIEIHCPKNKQVQQFIL